MLGLGLGLESGLGLGLGLGLDDLEVAVHREVDALAYYLTSLLAY